MILNREVYKFHVAGYYKSGAKSPSGRVMSGDELAYQLDTNSESQRDLEAEILRERSDIGRVEQW